MNIEINSTLELSDGKQYLVSSTANIDNVFYIYLIDPKDIQNQKLLKLNSDNNTLVLVTESEETEKVIPILLENSMNNLKELRNNREIIPLKLNEASYGFHPKSSKWKSN